MSRSGNYTRAVARLADAAVRASGCWKFGDDRAHSESVERRQVTTSQEWPIRRREVLSLMMEVLQSDLPNDLDDSQYYVIRKLLAAVTRVFYSDAMPAKAIWPLLYPKRERQIMRDNPAMGTIFLDEDERPIRKAECGLSSTLLRDLKQACAKFKQAFPSASGDLSDTLVRCPELLVAEGMSPGDSLRCGLDVNHKGEHVSKDGQRWNTDSTVDVAKAKTRKTGPGKKVKIPKPEEVEEAGDVPDGLVTDADADFEAAFAKEMGD